MIENWIRVYQVDEEYQAEIVKSLLEKYDLHPVLMDRKDDEFRLGFAEIFVAPEEAKKAMEIIRKNQEGQGNQQTD